MPDSEDAESDYSPTPEVLRRRRRYYVMGLCRHVGLSSDFIADVFAMDGSSVRRVLRSETVKRFKFGTVVGRIQSC